MKIAIIGTGKVGSVLALLLANKPEIDELLLINRTRKSAEGLKMDLMGTYPRLGAKINVGEYKDAKNSDIIFITCGVFGAPEGLNLFDVNSKIMEKIFERWKPKQDSKIVIITTPVDDTAMIALKLSGLDHKNVIGFGGQLDVNRLEYLIRNDIKNFTKEIDRQFLGLHGAGGIPIFTENVSNKDQIKDDSKNYFKKHLSGLKISTLGTSSELAKLADILMGDVKQVIDISYYSEKYGLFLTWPCLVDKNGVSVPIDVRLIETEKIELENLISSRKAIK